MNKDTSAVEMSEGQLILEEEDEISNITIMPDVDLLYKVGTVVKRLLPISE